jgi:hypothetical protein
MSKKRNIFPKRGGAWRGLSARLLQMGLTRLRDSGRSTDSGTEFDILTNIGVYYVPLIRSFKSIFPLSLGNYCYLGDMVITRKPAYKVA